MTFASSLSSLSLDRYAFKMKEKLIKKMENPTPKGRLLLNVQSIEAKPSEVNIFYEEGTITFSEDSGELAFTSTIHKDLCKLFVEKVAYLPVNEGALAIDFSNKASIRRYWIENIKNFNNSQHVVDELEKLLTKHNMLFYRHA